MSMGWWVCRKKMKETIHDMEMSYGTTGSLFRYPGGGVFFVKAVGSTTDCNQNFGSALFLEAGSGSALEWKA
jgi:hypothetical protein